MNTVFRLDTIDMDEVRRLCDFLRTTNCPIEVRIEQACNDTSWDDMTNEQKNKAYRVYFGEDR